MRCFVIVLSVCCGLGQTMEHCPEGVISGDTCVVPSNFLPALERNYLNKNFYLAGADSTGAYPLNRVVKILSLAPDGENWYWLKTDNPLDTIKCHLEKENDTVLWCPDLSVSPYVKEDWTSWDGGGKKGTRFWPEKNERIRIQNEEDEFAKKQAQEKTRKQKERKAAILEKFGNKYGPLILKGKIIIGMDRDMVIASWGSPESKNRTVGSWGVHEQWIYGNTYLYFDDGILKSFQDSE